MAQEPRRGRGGVELDARSSASADEGVRRKVFQASISEGPELIGRKGAAGHIALRDEGRTDVKPFAWN
jgi:hypothetical protein